jgi:PilZ domain-containing protein
MTASPLFAVNLEPYLTYWPVLAVGFAVGLAVLAVLSVRRFRAPGRDLPPPAAYLGPEDRLLDSNWQLDARSYSDRRAAVRRDGPPVGVLVSSPAFRNGIETGYVLDRSTGGLRLALTATVATGIALQVKAENAPANTPWVTVIVRNCRHAGQHYELGCEFDKTPPWNVLLLFG